MDVDERPRLGHGRMNAVTMLFKLTGLAGAITGGAMTDTLVGSVSNAALWMTTTDAVFDHLAAGGMTPVKWGTYWGFSAASVAVQGVMPLLWGTAGAQECETCTSVPTASPTNAPTGGPPTAPTVPTETGWKDVVDRMIQAMLAIVAALAHVLKWIGILLNLTSWLLAPLSRCLGRVCGGACSCSGRIFGGACRCLCFPFRRRIDHESKLVRMARTRMKLKSVQRIMTATEAIGNRVQMGEDDVFASKSFLIAIVFSSGLLAALGMGIYVVYTVSVAVQQGNVLYPAYALSVIVAFVVFTWGILFIESGEGADRRTTARTMAWFVIQPCAAVVFALAAGTHASTGLGTAIDAWVSLHLARELALKFYSDELWKSFSKTGRDFDCISFALYIGLTAGELAVAFKNYGVHENYSAAAIVCAVQAVAVCAFFVYDDVSRGNTEGYARVEIENETEEESDEEEEDEGSVPSVPSTLSAVGEREFKAAFNGKQKVSGGG